MNATAKTMTLVEQLTRDADATATRAKREAEARLALAAWWDASGYTRATPGFIHSHGPAEKHYARAAGTLSFDDIAPDDALAMLEAFPPVACDYMRDGNTSTVRPSDCLADRYTVAGSSDGVLMSLDGGLGYGQTVKVQWWTERDGMRVELNAKLTGSRLPRIAPGRAVTFQHSVIRFEGQDNLVWPKDAQPDGLAFIRYARGSETAYQHFLVYRGVADWLRTVAALADAEGRETRAAYEAARALVTEAPRVATAEEVEARRAVYEMEKLRAGTLLQFATLATPTAQEWMRLAEKHWPRFAEAHGLEVSKYRPGFDHYAATCWYLTEAGVITDEGRKYGAAWY